MVKLYQRSFPNWNFQVRAWDVKLKNRSITWAQIVHLAGMRFDNYRIAITKKSCGEEKDDKETNEIINVTDNSG